MQGHGIFRILAIAAWALSFRASEAAAAAPVGCELRRDFWIEGERTPLCLSRATESWISPSCAEKRGTRPCGAWGLLKKAKATASKKPIHPEGGKNPTTAFCQHLGGKIVIARLEDGSEGSFCEARDGTLIDCASLHLAGTPSPR